MNPRSFVKLFLQFLILQLLCLWVFEKTWPIQPEKESGAVFLDYCSRIFLESMENDNFEDLNRFFTEHKEHLHTLDLVIYNSSGSVIFKNHEAAYTLSIEAIQKTLSSLQDRGSSIYEVGYPSPYHFHYAKPLWKEERLLGFMDLRGKSKSLPEHGSLFSFRFFTRAMWISLLSSVLIVIILYFIWFFPRIREMAVWKKKSLDLTRSFNGETAGEIHLEKVDDVFQKTKEILFELKSKTREWETLLSSMNEGVIAIDKVFRIQTINSAAKKIFAMEEVSRGTDLLQWIRNSRIESLIRRTLDLKKSQEDDVTHPTGSRSLLLKIHASPWRDAEQNILGVVLVVADLSRLHNLENLRRDFVANVSHELRTPITSIQGYVETLIDGAYKSEQDALHFLEVIKRQSERLNGIIEDLLTLSRIEEEEESESPIEKQWHPVADILNEVAATFEQKSQEKKIRIVTQVQTPFKIFVSRELIMLALSNLVDNAIKHSQSESEVRMSASESSSHKVVLEVRDFGIGIDPVHLPRLFERFYRVDKARSRKNGGTGLGLAIAKHIAIAHGGEIKVESKPGKGSTFKLVIPTVF